MTAPCPVARLRDAFVLAVLIVALLAAATPATAQSCLDEVGHWSPGPSYAVAVSGNRLYYGEGADLVIADITSPGAPVEIGRVAVGDPVWSLAVHGSRVVVTDWWDSVYLVDVANPAAPTVLGHYGDPDGQIYGATLTATHAFVAVRSLGVRVVSLANPSAPQAVALLTIPGVEFMFDLQVAGSRLYVAADTLGLRIIDIANPLAPVALGSFTGSSDVTAVVVSGNLAYVAAGSDGSFVVDVANPAAPQALGHAPGSGYDRRVHLQGQHLYVASQVVGGGVRVIDVAVPTQPVQVATHSVHNAMAIAGSGNWLYVPGRLHIAVVDVALPTSPVAGTPIATASTSLEVAWMGNRLLVAGGNAGLVVLDAGGGALVERARVGVGGYASRVAVLGSHAYVVDGFFLRVVDVSDPDAPQQVHAIEANTATWYDAVVAGQRLYLANGIAGLKVYDLADPAQPQLLATWQPASGAVTRIAVRGTLGLAVGGTQAWTLNLAAALPAQQASIALANVALGVDLASDIGYIATGTDGLQTYALSNPTAPQLLDTFNPWPITAHSVRVDGDRAWIAADRWYGLIELDVSDPADLVQAGAVDTSGDARGVAYGGARVALADFDAGVRVFTCAVIFADGFE